RRTSVGALVQTTVAARPPQRPLGGDEDDVGVARVEDDLADVFGSLQSDALPALAAVERLVHAVAVADGALAVLLAGTDPDRVGVFRIERDVADGIRPLIVEHRRPG